MYLTTFEKQQGTLGSQKTSLSLEREREQQDGCYLQIIILLCIAAGMNIHHLLMQVSLSLSCFILAVMRL